MGAEKGTLTVMCGGDAALFERAKPVLRAFGEKLVLCGPTGSGDAVKAVNNALLAVHVWAAGEGLAALTKAGVSPAIALDVINASSGTEPHHRESLPRARAHARVPAHVPSRAARQGRRHRGRRGARAEGAVAAAPAHERALSRCAHMLGEEADHVEAVRVIEQWAGVEIK